MLRFTIVYFWVQVHQSYKENHRSDSHQRSVTLACMVGLCYSEEHIIKSCQSFMLL